MPNQKSQSIPEHHSVIIPIIKWLLISAEEEVRLLGIRDDHIEIFGPFRRLRQIDHPAIPEPRHNTASYTKMCSLHKIRITVGDDEYLFIVVLEHCQEVDEFRVGLDIFV